MRDIASVDIVWNQQGQLLLNYADQANTPEDLQKEHGVLSAALFCACQLCVLEPRICHQLCKGIYDITVNGNLSPRPIEDVLQEARLELKEISSNTGDSLLVVMFHPTLRRFGFVGSSANEAVKTLIENYAKHMLASGIESDALRLSLAATAMFYVFRLQQVGAGEIASEMRTYHYSLSSVTWPQMRQATQEQLKMAFRNFRTAIQSI